MTEPVITAVTFAPTLVSELTRAATTSAGGPGHVAVLATFDDSTTVEVFTYYTDELTFTSDDLIGLTAAQARDLHRARDLAWLTSPDPPGPGTGGRPTR